MSRDDWGVMDGEAKDDYGIDLRILLIAAAKLLKTATAF